jgi:GGDEF domain-containing protein
VVAQHARHRPLGQCWCGGPRSPATHHADRDWRRDEAARLGASLEELIGGIREARQLSVTDHLTGLGNLRRLREALHHEAERAGRFGRTLGVLVLDLDHFKQVNDQHGHRAGDAVLVEFAQRVRGVLREVDLTFRQGGEEFVVLLPETDLAGGITAAQRMETVRRRPSPSCVGTGSRRSSP